LLPFDGASASRESQIASAKPFHEAASRNSSRNAPGVRNGQKKTAAARRSKLPTDIDQHVTMRETFIG